MTVYRTSDLSVDSPRGLAIDTDKKRLAICDTTNNRLNIAALDGLDSIETTSTYYASGSTKTTMSGPQGVTYYDGYYYVCDTGNHVVVRLDAYDYSYKGHFGTVGSSGSTTATLNTPRDVTHDKRWLYIVDQGNNRIVKLLMSDLSYVDQAGTFNSVALNTPVGIAYQDKGDKALFIADTNGSRIVKCTTKFKYITQKTGISTPLGLTVYDNFVHLCSGNSILVYDTGTLTLQTTLTESSVTLSTPQKITHYRNSIFIADTGNDRITVWRGYTPEESLETDSRAVFSGDFNDGFTLIADDDEVIAGATQEYTAQNRWVEEKQNNFEFGWTEE